jgi:hypothetical protein
MITDLTFWQNLGALGVGFLVWMGILIAGWWATTVGLAFISKWTIVNKALGWVLLLAMSLGVVWIFWATGVRLLHR